MSNDVPSLSKASRVGFHFFNTYQQCPWAWYLRYVVGLEPDHVSKFLSFGTAIHAALEAFYTAMRDALGVTCDDLVACGLATLDAARPQYAKADEYDADRARLPTFVKAWYDAHALDDMRTYDIVEVEKEIVFPLPGDFEMTVRKDVTLRERGTGRLVVLEHKTTSRSVSQMATSVALSLQVDVQMLGTAHDLAVDPSNVVVVPDVIYQRMNGPVRAERPYAISRSRRELRDAEAHFAGLAMETTAKVASLETTPPEVLFARNGAWCGQGLGCAYIDICRQATPECAPVGFHFVERAADENV